MKIFEIKEKVKVNSRWLGKYEYFTWPDDVIYWWQNEDETCHVVLWHGTLHEVKDDDIFHLSDKIPQRL